MRSSAKPLQALPLALEDAGPAATRSWRSRAPRTTARRSSSPPCARCSRAPGASEDDLECGAGARRAPPPQLLRASTPGCCSSADPRLAAEGYRLPDHPLQIELRGRRRRERSGSRADEVATAVDGCGVPTFAASARGDGAHVLAARHGSSPGAERVIAAMRAHPELSAGRQSVDTLSCARCPARRQARRRGAPLRRAPGRDRRGAEGRGRGEPRHGPAARCRPRYRELAVRAGYSTAAARRSGRVVGGAAEKFAYQFSTRRCRIRHR